MSANEVIEQIEHLPAKEQEKIVAYVDENRERFTLARKEIVSEEFKRIADKVFTNNAELFRKLAQ